MERNEIEVIWYDEVVNKPCNPKLFELLKQYEGYTQWICSASGISVGVMNGKDISQESQNSEDSSRQRQETPKSQ